MHICIYIYSLALPSLSDRFVGALDEWEETEYSAMQAAGVKKKLLAKKKKIAGTVTTHNRHKQCSYADAHKHVYDDMHARSLTHMHKHTHAHYARMHTITHTHEFT